MTIGERFKEIRKMADEPKKKCSQAEFGEMFKIGRDAVANIENGRVEPSELLMRSVCARFDVSYDWLRNGTEPMRIPKPEADEFIDELLAGSDNPFIDLIKATLKVYAALPDDDKKKLAEFAKSLKNEIKEGRD